MSADNVGDCRPIEPVTDPIATATRITHLVMMRPDLAEAEAFLNDFGLITVSRDAEALHLRGTDRAPYVYRVVRGPSARFVGFGLGVDDASAFERLRGLGEPVETDDRPGGGELVRLTDPAGFVVEVVHGDTPAGALDTRAPLSPNTPWETRRRNEGLRPELAPAAVIRLGHVVLNVVNFNRCLDWYRRHFGFLVSDALCVDDGTPVAAFLRCNLGETPSDHHSVFLASGVDDSFGHAAFEVADLDAVAMGQEFLKHRNYRHAWGIGRHLLGSQIFDYWRDRWGDKHEHYADGDRLDASVATGYHPLSAAGLYQWGPDFPKDFDGPRPTPATVVRIIRTLRADNELTWPKLKAMLAAFGRPARTWMK